MIKSIMIVDEDSNVLRKLKSFLEEEEINVKTVKTNREAIEVLEKEKSISAILLHTRMPDGKEVFIPFIKKDEKTLPLDMEISADFDKGDIIELINKLSNL